MVSTLDLVIRECNARKSPVIRAIFKNSMWNHSLKSSYVLSLIILKSRLIHNKYYERMNEYIDLESKRGQQQFFFAHFFAGS